jgi:hypothetical protein
MARVVEVHEPESYAEAAEDARWRAAMEEEMHALAENETWDLVDAPACRIRASNGRVHTVHWWTSHTCNMLE